MPSLPEETLTVTSPLHEEAWAELLAEHPDQEFASFILRGIQRGFRIGFGSSGTELKSRRRNMLSATANPQVVTEYLQEELRLGRIAKAGPIETVRSFGIQCSPFGVIPKRNKPGKWRLILDLSSPEGYSVNDGVCKDLASVAYVSVDDVVACVVRLGKGTIMAKMDIRQAYRNIPVHPSDRPLLGMVWEEEVYIDKVLPFGLRSAPLLFTAVADALLWIMKSQGIEWVFHYIDDFITLGKPGTGECARNVHIMKGSCATTGLPVELEKDEGPATTIGFLGMELDSEALEVRLPQDKLVRLSTTLREWRGRKASTKRELLSLIGILSHACKAVRAGRSFLRRLIDLSTTVRRLDRYVRLNASARSDIEWWHQFCSSWNGVSMMSAINKAQPAALVTSDASGSWGCGAFSGAKWFQLKWVGPIVDYHITVKELVPVVLAAAMWGAGWRGKTIKVLCDNSAVISIINGGTSKNQEAMHLRRCLAFVAAKFEFYMFAVHIKGEENTLADALSRDNLSLFRSLHPQAEKEASPISAQLLDLLILTKPDWTSPSWTPLWSSIFSMA